MSTDWGLMDDAWILRSTSSRQKIKDQHDRYTQKGEIKTGHSSHVMPQRVSTESARRNTQVDFTSAKLQWPGCMTPVFLSTKV